MSNVWFTADTHFGHAAIIRMCNRPFSSIEEHDAHLVSMWNSVVGPRDQVYFLGDFAHKADPDGARRIFNKLNGHKHLIIGNHDKAATKSLAWTTQQERMNLKINGDRIVLDHYPGRSWLGSAGGSYQLYGHVHGRSEVWPNSCDVGVDAWDYKPVSWPELKELMAMAPARVLEELDADETDEEVSTLKL